MVSGHTRARYKVSVRVGRLQAVLRSRDAHHRNGNNFVAPYNNVRSIPQKFFLLCVLLERALAEES